MGEKVEKGKRNRKGKGEKNLEMSWEAFCFFSAEV